MLGRKVITQTINHLAPVPLSSKSGTGFTLIELIVVIAIMGILASAASVNYRTSGYQRALFSDAREFASTIREAQADSLSGKLINDIRPDHGYGVYLETATDYILFADNNGDHIYQEDEKIRKINVSSRVSMKSSTSNCNTVIFVPPKGTVYFYYYDGTTANPLSDIVITFTLFHSATQQNKLIRVNKFGQIDILL